MKFDAKMASFATVRDLEYMEAIEKYGSLSVWKKINVLSIYFKNTNPALSALYNKDKNWIRTTFGLKAF
jgi:hypothetical protein